MTQPAVDWQSLVSRISLDGLTPVVELRVADSPWGKLLVISRRVRDFSKKEHCPRRLMGEHHGWHISCDRADMSREEWISVAYPVPSAATELDACRWICSAVSGNLAHEVAEWFRLDGRKVMDPHA